MANTPFKLISGSVVQRSLESTTGLPLPRTISTIVCTEENEIENERGLSELIVFFGQFLDHTITSISVDKKIHFLYQPMSF